MTETGPSPQPNQDETDIPGAPDRTDKDDNLYTGMCVGGPLDGQYETCRYPAGFVLVDRPAGRAWVYKRGGRRRWFIAALADGREARPYRAEMALEAALGERYDVRAVPAWGSHDGGS